MVFICWMMTYITQSKHQLYKYITYSLHLQSNKGNLFGIKLGALKYIKWYFLFMSSICDLPLNHAFSFQQCCSDDEITKANNKCRNKLHSTYTFQFVTEQNWELWLEKGREIITSTMPSCKLCVLLHLMYNSSWH